MSALDAQAMLRCGVLMLPMMAAGIAVAQEPIDAPPPPPPLQSGEALEPEVTIIQRNDEKVYEYRVSGRVYMVKVVPVVGPAYYFLDQNGDGVVTTEDFAGSGG